MTGLLLPLISIVAACLSVVTALAAAPATDPQWVKGNLHCHTINSDGVLPAPALARWYRENGFHFLFITDHNFRTGLPAESLKAINTRDFIVLPAEEFTGSYNIHVNIYGAPRALYDSLEFIHPFLYLRHALDAAGSAGALASVNHPVWRFGVSTQDLMSLSGVTHFELINEGPKGANEGDSAHPSTERMWDSLLSAGKRILILTGDDAHTVDPARGSAGCAFVMARVAALNKAEILKSLREGRCYGSTGPLFKSIDTQRNVLRIAAEKPGLIEFIGTHGRVLKSVSGAVAEMALDTAEIYVRARLTGADGLKAWTQPVFLKRADMAWAAEAEMDRIIAPLLSAETAYRNNRPAEALKKYAEIRTNLPAASPYYHSLSAGLALRTGRILEMQGKKEEALKEFEFVLEKSPVTSHRIMAAKEIFALSGAPPKDPRLEFVSCRAFALKKDGAPVIDARESDPAWQASPWTAFEVYRKGMEDSVFFKILYDASDLYVLVKAFLPDTEGVSLLDPLIHEGLSFHADPGRLGAAVVSAGNSTKGVRAKSRVEARGPFFMTEYRIPLKLFHKQPVKPGDLWGFNMARTYGKLGEKGWRTDLPNIKHTGWADRGGEAAKAPYLGLLKFE